MTNAERLEAAGLIKTSPLPEPYDSVVADLSDTEVEALVSAKERLDRAIEVQAHAGDDTPRPEDVFIAL
jgi:hypothetical protein